MLEMNEYLLPHLDGEIKCTSYELYNLHKLRESSTFHLFVLMICKYLRINRMGLLII